MIRFGKSYIIFLIICAIIVATAAYITSQVKYKEPENTGALIGINLPPYEIDHVGANRHFLHFRSQLSPTELEKLKNNWKDEGNGEYRAEHEGIVSYKAVFDSQSNSMDISANHDYPGTLFIYIIVFFCLLFILVVLFVIGVVFAIMMIFSKKFQHPTYVKWLVFVLVLLVVSIVFNSGMFIDVIKFISDVI